MLREVACVVGVFHVAIHCLQQGAYPCVVQHVPKCPLRRGQATTTAQASSYGLRHMPLRKCTSHMVHVLDWKKLLVRWRSSEAPLELIRG